MSFVGTTIGNIRIEKRLGTGGMGEVYLGFDQKLHRRVAVKTIRPEHRMSRRIKARFLREARMLSKLGHPGICQVYDVIETADADFLVLEYVEGQTLRQISPEELAFEEKLRLSEKIARALAAAHQEKIVHRDLKADNVMVTPAGEVKVLDFGIARSVSEQPASAPEDGADPDLVHEKEDSEKTRLLPLQGPWPPFAPDISSLFEEPEQLTRLGMVVGTIGAMSPEQAGAGKVSEASDLYSLGILLQELFTGEPAYEGRGTIELLPRVARAETRPIAGLDPDLTALIRDLLNLDPRRRPTAGQTAERLRWILDKPQRLRRRHLRVAAVASSFVVLLAVLAVVSWLAVEAERARREAERRRQQAEGLIAFMLDDLRPRLGAVGRLDLLKAVSDRALSYFEEVPEEQLTEKELAGRVATVLEIGVVRRDQGDLPAALAAFRKAGDMSATLVARNPENREWQVILVEAHSWAGQVFFEQGKPAEALAEWRRTLELARSQVKQRPDDVVWLNLLALAHHNVGTALEVRGDVAEALRSYRESLALKRRMVAARPGALNLQEELAATLAWVSSVLERQGDLAAALAERRAHLEIYERLAKREPESAKHRAELAGAQGFTAGLLVTVGDLPAARELYEAGLATYEELSARDPDNAIWRRWLSAFHSALGRLAWEEGNSQLAVESLRTALAISEGLVSQDPTNTDWRDQRATTHSRMAAALAAIAPPAAREEARTALSQLREILEGEPDEATLGLVAETEVLLGHVEAELGNPGEARAAWERALAVLDPAPRPRASWRLLDPEARALLALGRTTEARPIVERLHRMGYRGGAFLSAAGSGAPRLE
jgi:tetratricopeptide (TPR) repeat protein/tRNA A-37 threonylcarbamoyl transferase component Bud32